MKKLVSLVILLIFTIQSCNNSTNKTIQEKETSSSEIESSLLSDVLTRSVRDSFSTNEIIQSLKDGNTRFMKNELTARDLPKQVTNSTKDQFPEAIILSCVDSRVPVENVFDRGIGDIFVARVAGNFVNEDILGSMEYACLVAGSKVIVVMGHEHCGALSSAVKKVTVEESNINGLLANLQPAIDSVKYDGERVYDNGVFMDLVCKSNVINTINEIKSESPILNKMEVDGDIQIVGAVYNMTTGKVMFL